jgi:hypothetical protein
MAFLLVALCVLYIATTKLIVAILSHPALPRSIIHNLGAIDHEPGSPTISLIIQMRNGIATIDFEKTKK